MKRPASTSKRLVRYFVSYAHADGALPGKLLAELEKQLGACKDFTFERWQDTDLLVGEKWHDQIQQAARKCDFGLLLVSPAFLGSKYIGEHELPHFVGSGKLCIPVGLCRIDFKNQDLKGLEELQIFLHATAHGKARKCFADCGGKLAADFAHALFGQITKRLGKIRSPKSAAKPALKKSARKSKPAPAASHRPSNAINLPHLPYFFGRTDELKKLADALSPKTRTWGALIDGPGGMGKTSLAIRAAEESAANFQHIYFLSSKERKMTAEGERKLTDFVVPGYLDMLNELARLLKLPDLAKRPEGDRARLLIEALAPVQALLILDNLESLPKDDQNRLFEFLSQLPPGCKAIVTSRRRTDVDARIIRLGKLEQDAALKLIAELATDRPLLAKATEKERIHLYEETGGNPLLLRWIAGQLGRGSCRTLAAALALCRDAAKENDPLEFIFGDLLETFTEAETRALAALSYFTQQVEVKLIAELADLSKTATETALGDLSSRALVIPDDEEKHFALVPMAADFLRKKRPEAITETGNRLEKHVLALVLSNGFANYNRFPVLDNEWLTVSAALPSFLSGSNHRLQAVCDMLTLFLDYTGRWDERLVLAHDAEHRAVIEKDDFHAGWRAFEAAMVHCLRGQTDEMKACADRVDVYWHKAAAGVREQAAAIYLRSMTLRQEKKNDAAIAALRKAIDLWRTASPESTDVAAGLNALAMLERDSGIRDAAERDYKEALRIYRKLDSAEGVAATIGNLAELRLDSNDWVEAEIQAREALCLAKEIGRRELLAANSHRVAMALVRQGKAVQALCFARDAVAIYAQLSSRDLEEARTTLSECRLAFALERLNHGWTYNTTTLEGNTLTLEETREALSNPAAVFPGRPATDTAATRAQGAALQVVAEFIRDDREWRAEDLFRLHTVLMQGSTVDSMKPVGTWKIEDNGTSIKLRGKMQWNDAYAAAHDVPALMAAWLAELNRLRDGKGDPFESQVWLHACFARIHPFADGNGRMARMLANIPLLAAGLDPVDIPATARDRYLASLASWQIACGPPRPGGELFAKPKLLADFRKLCKASRTS